jgi:ubiquinone/menaquinone biosynthesis C-methylase UbiE
LQLNPRFVRPTPLYRKRRRRMSNPDLEQEVPYGEDLQSAVGAAAWVLAADQKRPWRAEFRELIAAQIAALGGRRVLELGSGPGLLARCVLERCTAVREYVLIDFSEPMLAMSRENLAGFSGARFILGDFRADSWFAQASPPFDSILAMQSVHEVRHKRHVPMLYSRMRRLAAPAATIFVCDHTPKNETVRLKLGEAFDVTADKKQTDFRRREPLNRASYVFESAYEIVLKNAKKEAATVVVREPVPGEWTMLDETQRHAKVAAGTAEWRVKVPAEGSTTLRYRVLVRY